MRASKRRFCSSLPTSSQYLNRMMPSLMSCCSIQRRQLQEFLVFLRRAEAHDVLDAGAIVPAAVEDHDLAGRGEPLQIALDVELALLAVGGRR